MGDVTATNTLTDLTTTAITEAPPLDQVMDEHGNLHPSPAGDRARPHGDRAKYVRENCKCSPCRAANASYQRQRLRDRNRPDGDWDAGYVDATDAKNHLHALQAQKIGLREVARRSGLSRSVLQAVASGSRQKVSRRTAEKLLQVTGDDFADGAYMPVDRARKVVIMLNEAGYRTEFILDQTGLDVEALRFRGTQVRAATVAALEDLCARLGAQVAPGGRVTGPLLPPAAWQSLEAHRQRSASLRGAMVQRLI